LRKQRRTYLMPAVLAVVALLATACGGDDGGGGGDAGGDTGDGGTAAPADGPTITVGTVNFAENRILGQMYAQALEAAGYPVEVRENIGSREVVNPALEGGDLDLIVEYTGNALRAQRQGEELDLREPQEVYDALKQGYEEKGVTALEFSEAQDVDGLAVTRETAEEYGLETISDIGTKFDGTFRFGGGPECPDRLSCLEGYRQIYGFTEDQFQFVSLDTAGPITVEALVSGEVDGANLFTTQSVVAANDFVLLEDDQQMQLPQNIVPVVRQEIVDAYGDDLVSVLNSVTAELSTELLTDLNAKAEIDQEDPADIAEAWLQENGLLDG
jgi:osmoprotectant transport system substrate-binding protein